MLDVIIGFGILAITLFIFVTVDFKKEIDELFKK